MKNLSRVVGAAALSLPFLAAASAPAGQVTGYLANPIVDYGSTYGNSGTGFGIRGWGMLSPSWAVHGEFESTEMEDADVTAQSLRLGAGFVGATGGPMKWLAKGEYVDLGSDLDQSGFGVHAGLMVEPQSALSWFGTLGYLSTDDTDGLEVNVGAHYAFSPRWGGVLDYRNYMGSVDPSGDFDLSEFRLGAAFSF